MRSVEEVLSELPTIPPKALLVLNKVDRTDSETLAQAKQTYPEATFISATERLGLETLRQRLGQLIDTLTPDRNEARQRSLQ